MPGNVAATGWSARRPHLRWGDLGRAVVGLVGAALGLVVASWLVPDFDIGGPVQALVAAVLVFVLRRRRPAGPRHRGGGAGAGSARS